MLLCLQQDVCRIQNGLCADSTHRITRWRRAGALTADRLGWLALGSSISVSEPQVLIFSGEDRGIHLRAIVMLEYYKACKIHSLGLDTQPTLKNVRYYFMPRKLKKNVCALEKCIPYVPEMRPSLPWLLSLKRPH